MPRLFCAFKIPAALSLQLSLLKGGLNGAKWIDPDNYHITLRFFGDLDRHTANDLALGLSSIRRHTMELEVDRLDAFGNSKPHALIANIRPLAALAELQNEIEWLGKRLGIAPDRRKFSPHVTLARLRGTTPLDLAGFIGARGGFYSHPFKVKEVELLSSKASIGGGPYITEARYPLLERVHEFERAS